MRFTIEAYGEGLTYQWQVSTNGGASYGNSEAGGYNTASMTVELQDHNPGYLYRCKVSDSAGNVVYSEPGMIRNGQISWDFTYDANGLRTKRTNGTTTYNYIYNGSQLTKMTVNSYMLNFAYDVDGKPAYVVYDGTKYFYMTNLQGDVVAIADKNGNVLVEYTYDAWGNILSTTGSMASTLGKYNPLRYRGYVYDQESALYYLQSRYYDPALGRFINSDVYASTGQSILGCNMFAYCGNNPVVRSDYDGDAWETVWDLVSLGLSIADVMNNPDDFWAWAGLIGDLVDVAIPFVGGLGEATRAINVASDVVDAADDYFDAGKIADNIDEVADNYQVVLEGACFVAGTLVLSKNGYVPIETITVGDFVWAWDEETGDVCLKPVIEIYVNQTLELIHISVNGEEIVTTPTHPFYSPVKGWTEAVLLRAGDILVLVNGDYVVVEKIQHEILESPIEVYNFQVEDYHTYYISQTGILVHNSCSQSFRFDENQQAVLDLAKEYKDGLSRQEAEILVGWANEYGISAHMPMTHPGKGGYWSDKLHINIRKLHIQVFE